MESLECAKELLAPVREVSQEAFNRAGKIICGNLDE
jgi:hypothetical protein